MNRTRRRIWAEQWWLLFAVVCFPNHCLAINELSSISRIKGEYVYWKIDVRDVPEHWGGRRTGHGIRALKKSGKSRRYSSSSKSSKKSSKSAKKSSSSRFSNDIERTRVGSFLEVQRHGYLPPTESNSSGDRSPSKSQRAPTAKPSRPTHTPSLNLSPAPTPNPSKLVFPSSSTPTMVPSYEQDVSQAPSLAERRTASPTNSPLTQTPQPSISFEPSQLPTLSPTNSSLSSFPSDTPSLSSDAPSLSSGAPTRSSSPPSTSPSISPSASSKPTRSFKPSVSHQPTKSSSPSISPSLYPSGSPTTNLPSTIPTITPGPSVSSYPSNVPTITMMPTTTSRPTHSMSPTSSPTMSPRPSVSTMPSTIPSIVLPSSLPTIGTSSPSILPSISPSSSVRPSTLPSFIPTATIEETVNPTVDNRVTAPPTPFAIRRRIPPFTLEYEIIPFDEPVENELRELESLTSGYLRKNVLGTISSGDLLLVDFLTTYVSFESVSDIAVVLVTFESSGFFDPETPIFPTEGEMIEQIVSAFVGDEMSGYTGLVQALPKENCFSSSTNILLLNDVDTIDTPLKEEETEQPVRRDTMFVVPTIVIVIIGVPLIILGSILWVHGRRRRRRRRCEASKKFIYRVNGGGEKKETTSSSHEVSTSHGTDLGDRTISEHPVASQGSTSDSNWGDVLVDTTEYGSLIPEQERRRRPGRGVVDKTSTSTRNRLHEVKSDTFYSDIEGTRDEKEETLDTLEKSTPRKSMRDKFEDSAFYTNGGPRRGESNYSHSPSAATWEDRRPQLSIASSEDDDNEEENEFFCGPYFLRAQKGLPGSSYEIHHDDDDDDDDYVDDETMKSKLSSSSSSSEGPSFDSNHEVRYPI